MKILGIIRKRLNIFGFRQIFFWTIIFLLILFIEKQFFPASKELVRLNVFGRTSYILSLLFVIIFFIMERRRLFAINKIERDYKICLIALALHIVFFISFVKFKAAIVNHPGILSSNFYLFVFLRYLLPFLMFLTLGFAIFGKELIKKFYKSIIISLVLAFTFFHISLLFQKYWQYFSVFTTAVVAFLLKLSFNDVITNYETTDKGPLLKTGDFSAYIESPCSGVEGLTLFLFLNLLIFIFDFKEINKFRSAFALFLGLLGVFFVNSLRIYSLYLVGFFYNPKLAIHFFHTNAGWFLFIIYFIMYWFLVYYFVRKK